MLGSSCEVAIPDAPLPSTLIFRQENESYSLIAIGWPRLKRCPVCGSDLSQWTEEFSQILRKQLGLLHRGKVSALGHHRPARNV